MASKNGEDNAYEVCKINLSCANFVLRFKEIVKGIILNKIVAQKSDREFWDELLDLFDKIGFQLMNDNEMFVSLGRVDMAMRKKKEKEAQEELDRINFRMRILEEQQKNLENQKELELERENKQENYRYDEKIK